MGLISGAAGDSTLTPARSLWVTAALLAVLPLQAALATHTLSLPRLMSGGLGLAAAAYLAKRGALPRAGVLGAVLAAWIGFRETLAFRVFRASGAVCVGSF